MLRPAVQPGAAHRLRLAGRGGDADVHRVRPAGGRRADRTASTGPSHHRDAEGAASPPRSKSSFRPRAARRPSASLTTRQEDPRPGALPLRRVLLPWAATAADAFAAAPPDRAAPSWRAATGPAAGLFFGEEAGCAKCHAVRGRGGDIGPDLSNLVHRDYASVLRDVDEPSAPSTPITSNTMS